MANPESHACSTCGHTWKRGQSGDHICSVRLRERVRELEGWLAEARRNAGEAAPERKPFSALESIFATALGEMTLRLSKLEEELEQERSAMTLTSEEGNEIIGELSAALAVLAGDAGLNPCVAPCPGHLKEKTEAAVYGALARWRAVEEERDRLRALAARQQDGLTRCLLYLRDGASFPREEVSRVLLDLLDDSDGGRSVEWVTEQIDAAYDAGRNEIRETPEYRAGAGLRSLGDLPLVHEEGSLQTGGIAGEKEMNVSDESLWGEPITDAREYLRRELSDAPSTKPEPDKGEIDLMAALKASLAQQKGK